MAEPSSPCPLTRGERILVALDGSLHSENALDQAISLAKVCNSSVFLVSVIDLYQEALENAPAVVEKITAEARSILEKGKEKAKKNGVVCETIMHISPRVHEFIVQEAKDRNIDLIVMGTRGRTGLNGLFMGSVAQKVISQAPCAVLITPD
jgi:nucleotide-binding universal stress UspA family protein